MQLTTVEQYEGEIGKEALDLIRIRLEILKSTLSLFETSKIKPTTSFDKN